MFHRKGLLSVNTGQPHFTVNNSILFKQSIFTWGVVTAPKRTALRQPSRSPNRLSFNPNNRLMITFLLQGLRICRRTLILCSDTHRLW